MSPRKRKEVDIYYYSHPKDGSIRYIGTEKEARVPLWLLNDREYQSWLPQLNPEINILDSVPQKEEIFWREYYTSLFASWGFQLIELNSSKDLYRKKATDILEINSIILKKSIKTDSIQIESNTEDLDYLSTELLRLSATSDSKLVYELCILIHCLFEIGIPYNRCIKMTNHEVLTKGFISTARLIFPFSDFLKAKVKSNVDRSQDCNHQHVFINLLKQRSNSEFQSYVILLINSVSSYLGSHFRTVGEFGKEYGQLQYKKDGQMNSRVTYLARYFNCSTRLELLVKLDLVPKLHDRSKY